MKVYGASVVKGMLYTLKTFFETYIEDFKRMGGKDGEYAEHGLRSQEEGIVTVMYPEEPMPIGSTFERFRVLPMLIYDKLPAGQAPAAPAQTRVAQEHPDKDIRCTACGICAKVCPPQCIWIVQESDEKGKPITNPNNFYIDTSVCMNCGMCAEFCPFDAIKMDHQFALNLTEQRREGYLYDLEKLLVPAEYYGELHPKANAEEEAARKAEAEAKAAKEAAKKEAAAKKAAEAAAAPAAAPADGAAPAAADDREARIAAAKAKAAAAKAAKEAAAAGGEAAPAGDATDAPAKAADPEREARIAAAKAKAAEAKAKKEAEKAAAAGEAPAEAAAEPVRAQDSVPVLAEGEAPASAAPAKAVDPEREARIAAAKAKAAEAKAKKEAEKAAAAAAEGAPPAEAAAPINPEVTLADSSAAAASASETVSHPQDSSPISVGQAEQSNEKEPAAMTNSQNASISKGADVGHAIAQNDPVFTDPAPAGEIGQQPEIQPAQDGEDEAPPPSSEGNFTPDTVTAGDEAAAKPDLPLPSSRRPVESNPPLAAGGLGVAAGDEFAAASAQPADSPDPKRHERKAPADTNQAADEASDTPPKASDA